MYFTRVCVPQSKETQRESRFCEVLCASEWTNTAWIMYFTNVSVPQSKETQRESCISGGLVCLRVKTQRESCILQGFVCFRLMKHSVNQVFYKGLYASEDRDAAWITYFTRVCVPPSKETQRESRISRGFVCLRKNNTQRESHLSRMFLRIRVQKRSVNQVFYKGLCASE